MCMDIFLEGLFRYHAFFGQNEPKIHLRSLVNLKLSEKKHLDFVSKGRKLFGILSRAT